jgi:predicted MPP superfamily phosphohydrolase
MMPNQRKKQQWLRDLARLKPDFVVATGDFLSHRDSVGPVLSALDPLLDFPGVFVFGSNDYYAPSLKNPARYLFSDDGKRIHGEELPWRDLQAGLEGRGWQNLNNSVGSIHTSECMFNFQGVDDAHLGRDDLSVAGRDINPYVYTIGVTHAPYLRVLDAMHDSMLQLIFAGHTHGGQLRIPFYGALVTNCDLPRKKARGLSSHKGTDLHISAGLGTNPYTPVRFACRPEASLVTLTRLITE